MVRIHQLLSAAAVLAAGSLQAQVLSPGGTIFNPGVDNQVSLGGTFVESGTLNIYGAGTLNGGVTSGVVTGDPANTLGGLTFFYNISNTGSDALSSLTIPKFTGFGTQVAETAGLGTVAPAAASRDSGAGDAVSFFFASPFTSIAAGSGSTLLLVHTDATQYGSFSGTVAGDNGGAVVTLFAPVPEPMTTSVVAGACLLTGLALKRHRKQ